MEATDRVQDYGCVALPDEIQKMTGLYPGATFTLKLKGDGNVLLVPVKRSQPSMIQSGVSCG